MMGMDCCCAGGTPVSGIVIGCGNFPPTAALVEIQPSAGGAPFGILATDASGHYSGSVNIPADGSYRFVVHADAVNDPFAARFATSVITRTLTIAGPNNIPVTTLPAATGYHCSGLLYYPLKDTLRLTDSDEGITVTLTYNGTTTTWTFGTARNYAGCAASGCTAQNNVQRSWAFNGSQIQTSYTRSSGGASSTPVNCPQLSANTLGDVNVPLTVTSASPFNASGTLAAGNGSRWYCGRVSQFTLTETP
jgi:hypothetical protein